MISSQRLKRLLVVRERVRDAERASEEDRARALELATSALDTRRLETSAALHALSADAEVSVGALSLLAQARAESLARERAAETQWIEATAVRDAQRARRHLAERDVKLAELARTQAAHREAREADRSELRTNDDRTAVVHHRGGEMIEGRER